METLSKASTMRSNRALDVLRTLSVPRVQVDSVLESALVLSLEAYE